MSPELKSLGLCPLGDYYDPSEIIRMSLNAESDGFSEVWIPEHFCSGDAISVLGALAYMTKDIKLATGVVGATNRHPVLTAMTIANLQEISHGRMTLGLGLTVLSWLDRLGYDYTRPLSLIREAFTIIREMLEGRTVDFEGRYFKAKGMRLLRIPKKRTPIFIAAVGPHMLDFAARNADGILLTAVCSPDYVRRAKKIILEAAKASKRETFPLTYSLILSSIGQKTNPVLINSLLDMLGRPGRPKQVLAEGTYSERTMTELAEAMKRGRRDTAKSYLTEEIIDQVAVRGPLTKCEETLLRFEKAGVDLPILMPVPGTYEETARLASRIAGV